MKKFQLLFLIALCLQLKVQGFPNSNYFYYYKGKPVSLEVDSTKVLVISEADLSRTGIIPNEAIVIDSRQREIYNTTSRLKKSSVADRLFFTTLQYKNTDNQIRQTNITEALKTKGEIIQVLPSFRKNGKNFDVTNRFYVKLKSLEDSLLIYDMADRYSLNIIGQNKYMPLWYTIACTKDSQLNSIDAANLFYETGFFAATEPEFLNNIHVTSNDPFYEEQWGLKNTGQNEGILGMDINVEGAWNITTGVDSIIVAVYDHGVEENHSDLVGRVTTRHDVNFGDSIICYSGHGTKSAGIIAASHNDIGIKGIAPNINLVSISHPMGTQYDYTEEFVDGFNWAWQEGNVDIINCPWYALNQSQELDDAIKDALMHGRKGNGCVIVFSSGNDDYHMVNYPGDTHPDILVVGGVLNNGKRCNENDTNWGSNYGELLDVMAPGENIKSTTLYNRYIEDSGTSFACAHVSGVAALMLSVNPSLTNVEINDLIEATARKIHSSLYSYRTTENRLNGTWNNEMGYGLIDATAAVRAATTFNRSGTHVSNQMISNNDTLYYSNVTMDNVHITDSASILILKSQNLVLNSNVRIDKGVKFNVSNFTIR